MHNTLLLKKCRKCNLFNSDCKLFKQIHVYINCIFLTKISETLYLFVINFEFIVAKLEFIYGKLSIKKHIASASSVMQPTGQLDLLNLTTV